MSEGEFKKRIKNAKENMNYELNDEGLVLSPGIFLDFFEFNIDEAKKEFPMLHFEFQEPRKWNFVQYKHHYESLAHQVMELLEWFVKYFGEVKKDE